MSLLPKLGCRCQCHVSPGVKHLVACCDKPPFRTEKEDAWSEDIERAMRIQKAARESDGYLRVNPRGMR